MNCVLSPDNILYHTPMFREIYNLVGHVLPCWLSYFVAGIVIILVLTNAVLLGAAAFSWMERRLIGKFQNRLGPNRWGPFGLFQPIADLVKLLFKEDLTPGTADRLVFLAVPIAMVVPVMLTLAVVPFAKNTALANLNVGVLYILAVTSITSIAIFMAGWSSNNRFALFGAARGVAVLISYEVPVVVSLLGVVMVSGSMSLDDVVSAQTLPFIIVQPLAFIVFVAGTTAELNRTPFDMAEAESELIAGYHTEYSGIKFAMIQAAEFGGVMVASAVITTLFPEWLGRPGGTLAGVALVPDKDNHGGHHIHLGEGHLPAAENRSASGLRLEIPAAGQPDQPVRRRPRGLFPARCGGSAHARRSGHNDRHQPGSYGGLHPNFW